MINKSQPKILFLDIETSPILGYTWEMWDARVLKVLEPSKIICVGWKWFGDKSVNVSCLSDYKGYKPGVLNDKTLIQDVWKLLDEADVVCAHNGNAFDIKKLNARFVYYDMSLPSAYKTIDTLTIAKKNFKFDQNSLDSLGEYLNEGRKLSTGGFELWAQCIKGDMKSWAKMKEYNVGDVELLEKIYLRFRPFITNHPNLNTISKSHGADIDPTSCPVCQSLKLAKRGFSTTQYGLRQRYQCNTCGSWSSGALKYVKDSDDGDV